jgi:hypothetical protein
MFTLQVKALCEKAKEILMEESNVQVSYFTSLLKMSALPMLPYDGPLGQPLLSEPGFVLHNQSRHFGLYG